MNIQQKIESIFETLTPGQKKVAYLILRDIKEVAFCSAKMIGEKALVSEATVHRFAQSLGYDSFSSMQTAIQELFLKDRTVTRLQMSMQTKHSSSWLEKHYLTEMENLKETLALNQDQELLQAAQMLIDAKRIYVAGWRAGLAITSPLSYLLHYMLGNTRLIEQGQAAEYASSFQEGDVLIASGFPRYCTRTLALVEVAKKARADVIVITDGTLSPFVKPAAVVLYAYTYSQGFVDSYVAPLAVVNALILALSRLAPERVERNLVRMEDMFRLFEEEFTWNRKEGKDDLQ